MSSMKLRGLVLSSRPHKEQDRLIRVLTIENGVLLACAPGAGKTGSRHALSAQCGTLSDFTFNHSRGFLYVKESEIVEPFRGLYEDIEKLTAAAHILEITSDVCVSQDISSVIYPVTICALFALSETRKNTSPVISAFEWKVMDVSGYSADLSACPCGKSEKDSSFAFSFNRCRIFCLRPSCLSEAGKFKVISIGAVEALRFFKRAEASNLFSFTVSDEVSDELSEITRKYLCEHLEKKYCKMDMLDSIKDYSIYEPSE